MKMTTEQSVVGGKPIGSAVPKGRATESPDGISKTSKTVEARLLCADLLREATEPLGAETALAFAPSGHDDGLVLVTGIGGWRSPVPSSEPAENAALTALRYRRRVEATTEVRGVSHEVVAHPCILGTRVLAVVLTKRSGAATPFADIDRAMLMTLGLAVDRYRVLLTLEESLAEAEAVRRQLDAYAVDLRSTYLAEQDRSVELADALSELTMTYESTVRGLAIAVEAKDEYTGGHLYRVSRYGMAITAVMAPEHTDDPQFEYGFLLHDVGKLVVPDAVLMKDGPLDESEWALMRSHPEAGRNILAQIPFLSVANEIVHSHHERWDGMGYPRGLRGEEIPLGARIFPIADMFDAMTTTRPYRKALLVDEARTEVRRGSGTQFCPEAVDAFMSLAVDDLDHVRETVRPEHAP
jgi:HD-GYP domain-containing protein (c-di-GMP phosphodiesterase class II)